MWALLKTVTQNYEDSSYKGDGIATNDYNYSSTSSRRIVAMSESTERSGLISKMSKSKLTAQVVFTTFVACLGSVQYGYHTAELNAPQQVMSCSVFRIPK